MKKRVFFLTHLREGADPDEYERFLVEYDYPKTMELLPVSAYKATRLEGSVVSGRDPGYQYLEVLDVDDYEGYLAGFQNPTPEIQELIDRVFSFVDDKNFLDPYGTVVE